MKRRWLPIVLLALAGMTAEAQTVYLECPDVHTNLPDGGSATFEPWDIVRNNSGNYTVHASLPEFTQLSAVHRLSTGTDWLLAVTPPSSLGCPTPPGSFVPDACRDPRDVLLWDGDDGYLPFPDFAGAVALIPEDSGVDAAFLDPTGAVVISFDTPTLIGSIEYERSDLVRYNGASFDHVPYFDASAAGIPTTSNLISADRRGLLTIISFDVATDVTIDEEVVMFLPGQLVSWDGQALAVWDPQPGWPADLSSQVNALTFNAVPATTGPGSIGSLVVERSETASLRFSWSASDCAGGQNAAIYAGNLASLPPTPTNPNGYGHMPLVCQDAFPYLQEEVAPIPPGDLYFLVVARNAVGQEGSYGLGRNMTERPMLTGSCAGEKRLTCP